MGKDRLVTFQNIMSFDHCSTNACLDLCSQHWFCEIVCYSRHATSVLYSPSVCCPPQCISRRWLSCLVLNLATMQCSPQDSCELFLYCSTTSHGSVLKVSALTHI
ncbi:hypothetical protein BDR04DRAFT_750872 [Suillus decipiens]|nr:hypothetical protein BDR04DRAFT_750872 [Suillus decipiens]